MSNIHHHEQVIYTTKSEWYTLPGASDIQYQEQVIYTTKSKQYTLLWASNIHYQAWKQPDINFSKFHLDHTNIILKDNNLCSTGSLRLASITSAAIEVLTLQIWLQHNLFGNVIMFQAYNEQCGSGGWWLLWSPTDLPNATKLFRNTFNSWFSPLQSRSRLHSSYHVAKTQFLGMREEGRGQVDATRSVIDIILSCDQLFLMEWRSCVL